MNEELDFQIGISGDGLDVSQTEQAVQNIQQADIEKGITASEEPQELPEEVTPEVVQEEKKEGPTAGDYVADTFVGLGEGARKAASNIITTPERVIDFFNGEMEKEMATEEGYQTEWDQFMYGDGDPITTKTWWGGFVSAATEVGTTIGLTGGFGKLGTGASLAANIKSGAIIGARYDLLAKNENQDNMTGMLVKKVPALDNALATNDADHPAMRKLKHVVEGMGIGMVFDAALFKLAPVFKTGLEAGQEVAKKGAKKAGQVATDVYNEREALGQALKEDLGPIGTELSAAGKEAKEIGELTAKELGKFKDEFMGASDDQLTDFGKKVRDIIISRRQSVEKQTREQAKAQMKDPGVRFPKNEPIGDRHLGNSTSNSSASDVNKSMKKVKQDWGSQDGHVGSMTSNTQIDRMVAGTKQSEEVIKEILGNFRSQGFIKELEETARRQGKTLQESIGQDLDMFRAVYEGRNTENVNTREFFKLFTKDRTTLYSTTKSGKKVVVGEYVKPEYIKALDMVNTSLFNDIRDAGIGARELAEITDIKDIDGPAQQMFEKLIAGLRLRKISSAEVSQQLSEFGDARLSNKTRLTRKELIEKIDKDVQKSIDAFRMALDMTTEQDGDEVFKTIFEGISMADGVHTLDDLDAFMRKKMRGGTFAGDKKETGAFLREMGTMFTHSVLSGPKTSMRAILGTSTATFTRPMAMALGGAMRGDFMTARAGLASLNAMREAIPESFQLFKKKLNGYWAGDLSTIKTRYVERSAIDDQWQMYGHWAETRGNTTDKILYRMANMVRGMNDSSLLTYSTKIMASTDDAFALIIGRARAREKAFLAAAEQLPDGGMVNLDAKFFRQAEDYFNNEIFKPDGTLTDTAAEYSRKEATLTQDLTGFGKNLASAFDQAPWARPFFLFARTGINGLRLTAKHTPGFNFLVDEFNMIAKAKPGDNLSHLKQFGIETPQDLLNAKAIQNGRLAMGSAALSMASMAYLAGGLHGNGPTDRQKRQAWLDAGWKPRTIKLGGVWVNYDAFEPYNQILALVGDIGDHQDLMGEEWAEDRLLKLSMALASTATSKSYLAGMQSFVDLFSGQPGQQERIIASLMNNTVPLAGLRNEIGKVLSPYTRELGSDIGDSIRNRNLVTENIATDPLPIKYDILTGKPIKDHDFVTRMFNAVSPVNFNLDYSEGRQLLFNSGYDMRSSTYSAPDGTDLSDSPKVRSMFQQAIGKQNLEAVFNKMAQEESIQVSIAEMEWHKKNGMSDVEPKSFPHYKRIAKEFDKAKKRAWASLQQDQDVQKLLIEERNQKLKNVKANQGTIDKILEMPK
tara:strand:+ start:64 stop:3999 length:3936 start_codon:yes stop_codon:yes gene_type:complete